MNKQYLDYSLQKLRELLDIPSPGGYTHLAADYLMRELAVLGYEPRQTVKGGVAVDLGGGDSGDALLLCCHIDTLGGIVAEVKENGRLRVSPVGCLSPNNTEGENVRIHTRGGQVYTGTFQLLGPGYHTNKNYETEQRTFDSMEVVIDEATASRAATQELGVAAGDFVSFESRPRVTPSGYIKGRHLDDKLSTCILLALAKYLKEERVTPARRTYIHFTVYEEVGHGAAAYCPAGVTEVLGVDMGCIGEGLSCTERMVSICAKDSAGPSSYAMVTKLVEVAKAGGLAYAVDVYPYYVSDPDALLKAGFDVRHCVAGPGVYASHGYERSHLDGLVATYELVKGYLQK